MFWSLDGGKGCRGGAVAMAKGHVLSAEIDCSRDHGFCLRFLHVFFHVLKIAVSLL